jgi:murein tripeptide amidase MpaA
MNEDSVAPLELRFDRYYPYGELTSLLFQMVERYSHLLSIESIGKSFEQRDVWLVTATNFASGPASEKPAFWCDANIHATEVSPSSALLYLLNKLATEYGTNSDVTRLLDTRALYIVPRVNPDGAELYFDDKPRYIRSSVRPYPYDEEPIDGLRPGDIDGDHRRLLMRIPDPLGPWKCHPEESRLMVRRDPTEEGGAYYRILPEGLLQNYDGYTLKEQENKEGLDLNRNFPAAWRLNGEQHGAGPFPGSEPEVYNLLNFVSNHPNITGAITFHTYSGVLLRPSGTESDDGLPAEDLWTFQKIGKRGSEITGYPSASVFHEFRYHPKEVITGVFDDWMYDHRGVFAWTVEIWSPQRQAGITEYKFIDWRREHSHEDDLKMLKWSDEALNGKGYVAWYPFEHPQLGAVELGGWDAIYAFRNPPPQFLEREIAPLSDWVIFHALLSPRLEIAVAEAVPIGDGFIIRLVVDNTGWLPTYVTKRGLDRKMVRPVVVEIEPSDGTVLASGESRREIGQLEGRAYTTSTVGGWTSDSTDHRLKVEWTVIGPPTGSVKLTARHERAGTVRSVVHLGLQ